MTFRDLPDDLKGLLASAAAAVTASFLFSASITAASWDSSWLDHLTTFGAFLAVAAPVSLVAACVLGWPLYLLLTRLFGAIRWWWPIVAGGGIGAMLAAVLSASASVLIAIGAAAGFAFWLTLKATEGD